MLAALARTRVVHGAGHLPWAERPAAVTELLHEIVATARD